MCVCVEQSMECELAGENEVLGENLPPVPLCPPQIPHDVTRVGIRAAVVGSWQQIAWAMALSWQRFDAASRVTLTRKQTGHAPYKPLWFIFMTKCIYLILPQFILVTMNYLITEEMKRNELMSWISPSRQFSHYRCINLLYRFPESTNTSVELWGLNRKTLARWPTSIFQAAASEANTFPSLSIGWIGIKFLTITSNVCISVG
jgi:hypothetical protein